MNKIELLPFGFSYGDEYYTLSIYGNFMDCLTITYHKLKNKSDSLFSVCVEKDEKPKHIRDTKGCFNEFIGNTQTFDDAVDMVLDYLTNDLKVNFTGNEYCDC